MRWIIKEIHACVGNTRTQQDAQLDRFLKLKVDANLEDWVDYAMDVHLNSDVVEAITVDEKIFIQRNKDQEDTSEMTPSPRSWEMVSNIYTYLPEVLKTKFFTAEERKTGDDDLRILIRGKVGENAARELLRTISTKENNIKPAEILTGTAPKIPEEIVAKFRNQKALTQKIIADNIVNYLNTNMEAIEKSKNGKDPKGKETYMNIMSQLKEFVNMLNTATQILFVKRILAQKNGIILFNRLSSAFTTEILKSIGDAKNAIRDLTSDN